MKLFFGNMITKEQVGYKNSDGLAIRQFNDILKEQLGQFVFEIEEQDRKKLKEKFYVPQSLFKKIFLFIPAVTGLLIHLPLYYFVQWLGNSMNKEPGHYDSKIVGLLFILYPLFLLLLGSVLFLFTGNWLSFLLLPILPFTAWAYVQLKKQLD